MRIIDTREILLRDNYDVIVVGGGIAGVSAAVAAAREGVSTLLIEKTVALGGLATIGLISWYEPLCDGKGKKMISGIPEELIKLSIKYGFDDLPDAWREGKDTDETNQRYATHYSPTIFAMVLDQYLLENKVNIRFDSLATFPVMDKSHCRGIVVESKQGREFFGAKVVIDATGDADVLNRGGVPTELGENFLTYVAHGVDYQAASNYMETKDMKHMRKWFTYGSQLDGIGHPEGMKLFKGDNADEITEFVLIGRGNLFKKIKDRDRNERDITMLPSMPQFRKIRRLVGAYDFTGKEVGQQFEDSIGSTGDFRCRGKHYQIPYSSLYHSNFDNLLAAGRNISASGDGWEITRVIPVVALTGQAAGTAAALSVQSKKPVGDIDRRLLQKSLADNGVLL